MNALDNSLVKLPWIKIIECIRLNSSLFVCTSDISRLRLPSALAPKYTGCLNFVGALRSYREIITSQLWFNNDLVFSDYWCMLQGQLLFTHDGAVFINNFLHISYLEIKAPVEVRLTWTHVTYFLQKKIALSKTTQFFKHPTFDELFRRLLCLLCVGTAVL
jgi:hypothetical protein